MESVTYRFSGVTPYVMFAGLLLFTAFVPITLVKFAQTGEWFYLAWAAAVGWFWFNALRTAYRIELEGDEVVFRTLGGRKRTMLPRIRSIRSDERRLHNGSLRRRQGRSPRRLRRLPRLRDARQAGQSFCRAEGRVAG
jgi:hypothetical protein